MIGSPSRHGSMHMSKDCPENCFVILGETATGKSAVVSEVWDTLLGWKNALRYPKPRLSEKHETKMMNLM